MVVKSDGTNIWASCTVTSAGTINNAAQYDVPYYSASGTTNTMSGTAISGFQFDTTGAAPTAATAAQLGGLMNIAANAIVKSAGTSSAPVASLLSDNGTTATYTGTGGVSAPSFTATGSGAGYVELTQGTSPGAAPSNTVLLYVPTSVTAYGLVLPGAQPSGGSTFLSCTAANPSVCSWAAGGSGGDTITSPNSTLAVGGTSSNTTLDLQGSAGEIMAGATPALTYTPTLGKSGTAGTLSLFPASGNFTTTLGTAATASNTINFPATVPTTLDGMHCVTSSTTCTLTDNGYAYNSIPNADLANSSVTFNGVAVSLGSTGNINTSTSGDLLYSGGSGAALNGTGDFTFATHTLSGGASAILDLSAATGTAALKVPTNSSNTATAAGVIDFDTTGKMLHAYIDAVDSQLLSFPSGTALVNNTVPLAVVGSSNTQLKNSLLTDNGTTAIYSGTGGVTASGGPLTSGTASCIYGTAGGLCLGTGTPPTAAASYDQIWADATSGDLLANLGTTLAAAYVDTVGVTTQTTTYGAATTDNVVICNSTTAFTVTLPTVSIPDRVGIPRQEQEHWNVHRLCFGGH